ncbi:hypothetical protein TNCV_4925341 [Trichonephila clavipes]|nr:hypothetical protein TNCV_4925341 [Trichonephila clavipes]
MWMITKSVDCVVTIAGYNPCHTSRHRIKEALDVSLGCSSPFGFHRLSELIWFNSGLCITSQSLCNHGPHAFDWGWIGRTSRPRKHFNLMGKEELLIIACHV